MTPEEYQRIKEAEKEHLRSIRKLKQAVREAQRQRNVSESMRDMAEGGASALDTSSDAIDKLALETAHNEARLEVALESVEASAADGSIDEAAKLAQADEELRRARARELVRQLRGEPTAEKPTSDAEPAAEKPTSDAEPAAKKSKAAEKREPRDTPLPEKTIGRMKP